MMPSRRNSRAITPLVFRGKEAAHIVEVRSFEVRTVGAFDRFGNLVVGCVDEIANLAADGLLPIGRGIDVGVSTRVGSVGHAGSTVT